MNLTSRLDCNLKLAPTSILYAMRLLWVCILYCAVCSAFAEAFVIDQFNVTAELQNDGVMQVEEAITVTFSESRHGIFRFIPVDYDSGRRMARRIFISNVRVSNSEGRNLDTKISNEGPNLKIRIGNAKVTLPAGTTITYVIRYEAFGVVNWFKDATDWEPYAELYWNATGNEWQTEIRNATIRVKFPKVMDGKGLRARIFAGSYGAKDSESLVGITKKVYGESIETQCELTETELTCSRTEPLAAYQGMTFVIDLPEKLIKEPNWWQKLMFFLLPNLGFGLPLVAFVGLGLMWTRFGRDPKGGPVVVQYDAPDGLSGSEAGTMLDETVDSRDIAAGIVTLAVRGYLKMHVGEHGTMFSRPPTTLELIVPPRTNAGQLGPFEAQLLRRLESCPDGPISETDMRTYVAPHLSELKSSLYEQLVARSFYPSSPDAIRIGWMIGSVVFFGILAFILTAISPLKDPMPAIIGGVVSLPIIFLFARQMPRRTSVGAKALQRVRGFEEFIRRAQADQLRSALRQPGSGDGQPHSALELFEEYLPHAVAFGLTRQWAKAFDGLLTEMPDWYVSPYSGYNYMYFGPDFENSTSSLGSSATTPPRSSGASGGNSGWSGGGGFSGGGFGGGGGGSW